MLTTVLFFFTKCLIQTYTYLTLPAYFLVCQPWKILAKHYETKSKPINPLDAQHSAWVSCANPPMHDVHRCETLDEMFYRIGDYYGRKKLTFGSRVGSKSKARYEWKSIDDVIKRMENIARGLSLAGIKKGDLVLIFAETRLEWMLCAMALYKLGAQLVTLFAQLGHDGIIHGINQTKVRYAITTRAQLFKLRDCLPSTPTISQIVDIDGTTLDDNALPAHLSITSLAQVEKNGTHSDVKISPGTINIGSDIAVIMYTSGTTGAPKGVIATHSQMMASMRAINTITVDIMHESTKHVYVAYLPLGHMFEFAAQLFFLSIGTKVGYASATTLIDGAPGLAPGETSDIKLLEPTIMVTVPLVLDRIRRGVVEMLDTRPLFVQHLFYYLMDYKNHWRNKGYSTYLTNLIISRKAKAQLGGKMRYLLVGGAPTAPETQRFITLAFDTLVMQGYGGTEVSGASHVTTLYDLDVGHAGAPLHGVKVKLVDWTEGGYLVTDLPNPRGEIVMAGDLLTSGYYNLPDETNEVYKVGSDGIRWYYSGDIGEILPGGNFKIIDRRKDLIKLLNGEYFSLGKIEAAMKSCSFVDNICVHGEFAYNYLIGLIVPNTNALKTLAKQKHIKTEDLEELCENQLLTSIIGDAIGKYGMENGLSRREIPTKFKLCSMPWTPENGMLTAALKLRRKIIITHYSKELEQLFSGDLNNNCND